MTRAPATLLAVRKLLIDYLDVDKSRVRSQDLEPAEVGIVGDAAHIGEGDSYHLGTPEQARDGSYSVRESPRDGALTEYACALDVGEFEVTVAGRTYDLRHFSAWCVGQCKAGTADTRDLREIIWSPDGSTVRRWDRLGRRSTGDSSHRWHTHFSFHRDAIKAGRDLTPLFRRYLTTIGLLEEPDMTPAEMLAAKITNPVTGELATVAEFLQSINREAYTARLTAQAALAKVGGDLVDEAAIVAGVLAGLSPQAIAAAIPAALTQQVADELAARLAG